MTGRLPASARWPAVALCALAAACDQSATIASRWAIYQPLRSIEGGTIAVPRDSGDPLAGAAVRIPAFALADDVEVALEPGAAPVAPATEVAGPVVAWRPSGLVLRRPALFTVPFQLGEGQSLAALFIAASGPGGAVKLPHERLAIDAAAGVVRFTFDRLASFQAGAPR